MYLEGSYVSKVHVTHCNSRENSRHNIAQFQCRNEMGKTGKGMYSAPSSFQRREGWWLKRKKASGVVVAAL